MGHPAEEVEGGVGAAVEEVAAEHGVVGDGVAVGRRVEQVAGVVDEARAHEAGEVGVEGLEAGGVELAGEGWSEMAEE